MAVEAVVDEQLGTVLQRAQIVGFVGRFVPGDTTASGVGTGDQAKGHHKAKCEFLEVFHVLESP